MNVLFVKVPWMKYYTGEGDEETLVPSCGYIFQHVNGYYYGFADGLEEIALEDFEGVAEADEKVENVTVVWTAENRDGQNKVVGWYKEATIYRHVKESLSLDSERMLFKYVVKAPAKKSLLLPVELRLLDAQNEGICIEKDVKTLKDISMYIHNYDGDQMNFVFKDKDLEGQSILNFSQYEEYFMKADEFLEKDLYGKAVRLFNKAIAVEPELAIGYECKGSIFLSLKMYDEALKIYEKVLSLEPDNEGATYCMGLLLGLLGQYEKALPFFDRYLQARKQDVMALAERSIVHYHLGQMEQAHKDIQKALKKEPNSTLFVELSTYLK